MDQNQPGPSTSSPSTSFGSTTTTKIPDLDSHLRTIILGLENASGNGEKVPWTLPDKTKAALVAKAKLHLDSAIPIKPRKETVPVKECWTPETTRTTTTPDESSSATKRKNGTTFSALQRGIALRAPHSTISMLTWPQRHVPWWSAGSGGGKGDEGSEGDAASIMSKDNGKEDPDEGGTGSRKGSSKGSWLPSKKTLLIFLMGMITGGFIVLFSLSLTEIELDLDDAACAGCTGPVANGLVGKESMNDTRGRTPRNIVPRQDGKKKNETMEGQGKDSNNHVSTKEKIGSGKGSLPSATTAALVTTTKRPASGITTTRFQKSHTVTMTPTTSPLAASTKGGVDDSGPTVSNSSAGGGEGNIALSSPGGEMNSSPFTAATTTPRMTTSTEMDNDALPLMSPDPQLTTSSSTMASTTSATQLPTTIDAVSHRFRQTIGMDLSTSNRQLITESTLQTETSYPMMYEVTTPEGHDAVMMKTMETTPTSETSELDVTRTTVAETQATSGQSELKVTSFEVSISTTQPSATPVTTTELKATSSPESSATLPTTESESAIRVSDIDTSSSSPPSFTAATAVSLLLSSATPSQSSSPSSSPPTTPAQKTDAISPPFNTESSSSSTLLPLSSPSLELTINPEVVTSSHTSPMEQTVTTRPADASPPSSLTSTLISIQTTPHREDSGTAVTSVSPVYQDETLPPSPVPPTIQARHDDAYQQATSESSSPRTFVSQDHLTVGRTQPMWTTNAAVTQQTTTTEDVLGQFHTTSLDTTLSPTRNDMSTSLPEVKSMDDDEIPAEGQQPEAQSEQEQTQQVVSTPRKRKKGWWVRFVEAVKKYVVKVFE